MVYAPIANACLAHLRHSWLAYVRTFVRTPVRASCWGPADYELVAVLLISCHVVSGNGMA